MSFYKRYELDRLIADGETKTFRAIDNATGRAVLLHMFNPKAAPVLAALKAKLASDPRVPRPPLLELGEFAGSPYAVTEVVAGFTNLRDWIAALPSSPGVAAPAPAAPGPSAPPASPSGSAGSTRRLSTTEQFHSLFDDSPRAIPPVSAPPAAVAPPAPAARPAPIPQPPPPPIANVPMSPAASLLSKTVQPPPRQGAQISQQAPAPVTPAAPSDAGEFTRIFGGDSTPAPVPTPRPAAPAQGAPSGAPDQGEFTRMFGGASGPVRPEPQSVAPMHEAGEFTRLFNSPLGVPSAPPSPAWPGSGGQPPQTNAAPASSPIEGPGQDEFTRMFGGQAASAPVSSTPMASTPMAPPPAAAAPASGAPGSASPPTRTDTGQGEFTRWFKLEPESVKPRSAPPAPPPKPPADDFERQFGPMPVDNPAAPSFKEDRGEHTALFGMGQHAESINIEEEQARAARSAAPEAKPFQAPSEFTRMFGPGEDRKLALPDTPRVQPRTTSASGLFGPATQLGAKAQVTRPQTQVGPGEYTRLIATPKGAQVQQSQVAPAPPPKKNWLLILGIAIPVLALVAIAIVAILRNR